MNQAEIARINRTETTFDSLGLLLDDELLELLDEFSGT